MFGRSKRRTLRALQVEVTSRCTRTCTVCPRSALSSRWIDNDLSGELWRRLEPDLALAQHVHLQGWGEPLLHRGLRQMVRDCKKNGCTVGITTNGDLLGSAAAWIVEEALDLVTLSVAGGPEAHTRLKGGSRLEPILSVAAELARSSGTRRNRTRMQLAYLLTRDNACELPALVENAARSGLKEIFVAHLDCTPSPGLLNKSAFDSGGLAQGVSEHLDAAVRAARRRGVHFRGPAVHAQELLACALDPTRLAFVTAEGDVGPCVNGLLPISGLIPRCSHTGTYEVQPARYGNLRDASLREILQGPVRQAFVALIEHRLRAEKRFKTSVFADFGSEALQQLNEAARLRDRALAENPFPETCKGCHKAQGW